MRRLTLGLEELEAAVLGGAVLGGGGGGPIAEGLRIGRQALALGLPTLVSVEELSADALVATASLVGAPAARDASVTSDDYLRAWELLADTIGEPLGGVISCENGGTATTHGWLQSATFGIPVVDAPANGRAHPTGDMGSMGLQLVPDFVSYQAAVGGKRGIGTYLEQRVSGSLAVSNRLVRTAADAAGGLVAVARNPVRGAYLRRHAAPGAISQALALGRALLAVRGNGVEAAVAALTREIGATPMVRGTVDHVEIRSTDGFDVGILRVGRAELTIWNEYLTLDIDGRRLATFPDLIVTLDAETGVPLTSAEISIGQAIAIASAPSTSLILGAGLRDPANFRPLETAVKRDLLSYVSVSPV